MSDRVSDETLRAWTRTTAPDSDYHTMARELLAARERIAELIAEASTRCETSKPRSPGREAA